MSTVFLKNHYRNIFIVDSLAMWDGEKNSYDASSDVVITYDFGLKRKIQEQGGESHYVDHLIDKETMHAHNFPVYDFFRDWHFDAEGRDIFTHKNVPFGFSFRVDIWNDFTFYARLRLCLGSLRGIVFETIFLSSKETLIGSILDELGLSYGSLAHTVPIQQNDYYFPIAQWMDEQIRPKGLRGFLMKAREVVTALYGYTLPFLDKVVFQTNKKALFIQEYHPTRAIIATLKKDPNVQVVLANFSRGTKLTDHFSERLIPIGGSLQQYGEIAQALMEQFRLKRHAKLILANGEDISQGAYRIIETRIHSSLAKALRTLDSCISYLDKYPVALEVLIANIGHTATLFDCVCKSKNIPSYMIINGLLGNAHQDESKYATVINSYSTSIKENYFRGMDNVVCLGDPRMDMYPPDAHIRPINRKTPTITIGASGFNNVDLNSYVAIEFEFIHDILTAFSEIIKRNISVNLIIKVRPNGYKKQYENFIWEFFPDMPVEIISSASMRSVLEKTDFYISIQSQTLFEASCLGIPCLYYQKDDEIMDTPFDGHSELVTVDTIDGLIAAFLDFHSGSSRYDAFLDRTVMEHYVGPLDGKNLQRNSDFIYQLLAQQESK